MKYFSKAVITAKKDLQTTVFVILNQPKQNENPVFNQKILNENNAYKLFASDNKLKLSYVVYNVYSTDADVAANTFDEVFENLIKNNEAKYISSGEFTMDIRSKVKIKRNKRNPVKKIALILCICLIAGTASMLSFALGAKSSKTTNSTPNEGKTADESSTVDGMLIPVSEIKAETEGEQITISIDRSYSAIPKEDIQLKGNLINGTAEITLPDFDREDFFSHIPGYSYGFSTVPDSDKIEYYSGEKYNFKADTKLYRVLVKYGGGSGTKEDPYIINYFDQLELMAEEKARGYFKQTCNIEYPEWAKHTSIDTVNELKASPEKEMFEYDGGGYYIKNMNNPLFGKVSGAYIHDVNICNSSVRSSEYKYYGLIACEVYNYQYEDNVNKKNYETGETIIRNCTVSRSGIHIEYPKSDVESSNVVVTAHEVVAPDHIEYDDKGNPVTESEDKKPAVTIKGDYAVGGITGIGGQIENCYVYNLGIYCDIDKYYLYAGGISGKPANVINCAVNTMAVTGNVFTAGGIAGSTGGSRKYNALGDELPSYYGGNIQGCAAVDVRLSSEFAAGGIAGMATTNAKDALISNCYSYKARLSSGTKEDGVIKKSGYNGGIVGTDGQDANGHTIINTVSPTEYQYIGYSIKTKATSNEEVWLAPDYAYYQNTILNVLNLNSVIKNNPSEIFTGAFAIDGKLSDDEGSLPYPKSINNLFDKIIKKEE